MHAHTWEGHCEKRTSAFHMHMLGYNIWHTWLSTQGTRNDIRHRKKHSWWCKIWSHECSQKQAHAILERVWNSVQFLVTQMNFWLLFIGRFSHHFLVHSSSCWFNVWERKKSWLPTSSFTRVPSNVTRLLVMCQRCVPWDLCICCSLGCVRCLHSEGLHLAISMEVTPPQ